MFKESEQNYGGIDLESKLNHHVWSKHSTKEHTGIGILKSGKSDRNSRVL